MPSTGGCGRHALPGSSSSARRRLPALLLSLLFLSGCYSPERDLIQDPFNSPLIHILDSEFQPSTGSVSLRWEYIGSDPLQRVVVLRRIEFTFDSIGVVTQLTPVGEGRLVDAFQDQRPPAGELIEYSVSGVTPLNHIDARAVQVQIPGARILRLRRNPFQGRIQVDWQSVGSDLTAFEVIRSSDASESVVAVAGPDDDVFVDTEIEGNTVYTYRIRSVFSGGAALSSEALSAGVYALEREERVTGGDHVTLATGSAGASASLFASVSRVGKVDVAKYRYFFGTSFDGTQTVGAIREETVSTRLFDVDPSSVVIAGPNVFRPASGDERLFVAARSADGTEVEIRALSIPNLTTAWDGPASWPLTDADARIASVQAVDGNTYFSAGGTIRAYGPNLNKVADQPLPFDDPADLDAEGTWLWAVIPTEQRIVRADISAGPATALDWRTVELPVAGIAPTQMTLNRFGQLFVLDATARTVSAFETDLSFLVSWSLPDGDFSRGSISLDAGSGNLIHVCDSDGNVYTYLP